MLHPLNIQWLQYLILRTREFPLPLFYRLPQSRIFFYPQVKKTHTRTHTLTKGEKQGGNTKPSISLYIPYLAQKFPLLERR